MMEYNDGGLKEEGGSVDPVSGNEVPPGALAEEVRDDIPAQLSEGEFVFPADVVRYIGLEKLMMMRQEAKQGLMRMEQMGQMSNAEEATIEGEPPAEFFDIPDDMSVPQAALVLEMNEGGSVRSFEDLMGFGGGTPEQTGYDIVEYVNGNGRKILVVEVDGVPTNTIPEGFKRAEVRTEDGNVVNGQAGEEAAPAAAGGSGGGNMQPSAPQIMISETDDDAPSTKPEDTGATVVTGGYADNGMIVGGTRWGMERGIDGSITLKNSEYGNVTLSPEEAVKLELGSGQGGFKQGMKDAFANPLGNKERQTGILSTGSKTDPAAGNQVHKALVERAELQKLGEEFVKNNGSSNFSVSSIGDAIKSGGVAGAVLNAFKQVTGPNELEGNIAQILGKPSGQFSKADYATIGQIISGKPTTAHGSALGSTGQIDPSKYQELEAFIKAVKGETTAGQAQKDAAKSGSMVSNVPVVTPGSPSAAATSPTEVAGGRFNNTAGMRQEDDDNYQGAGVTFNYDSPQFGAGRTADDDYDDLADSNVFNDPAYNDQGPDNDNDSGGGNDWSNPTDDMFGGNTMIAKGGLLNKKKISSKRKKKKRKGLASK